jgi:hypothetical protein
LNERNCQKKTKQKNHKKPEKSEKPITGPIIIIHLLTQAWCVFPKFSGKIFRKRTLN